MLIHAGLCGARLGRLLSIPVPRRDDHHDDRCVMACHATVRMRRSLDNDEVDGGDDLA